MDILKNVRNDLKNNTDERTKKSFPRFFKEPVKYYGVKSALVVKIAKNYFPEVSKLTKSEIFTLAEDLFKSGFCEESWIAANWIHSIHDQFTKSDFLVFKTWIEQYVTNWATCDTFCNHSMGAFIERYPEFIENIKTMTKSNNRWVKRAAAVSLILPVRKGNYLSDVFEISDILLLDPDDMVQKGYGWLLKEASRLHQKEVFNYVVRHKDNMPRTALRYAIEKMPQEMRKLAMEK